MRKNLIREKSFSFAIAIIQCYKWLTTTHREYVLSKQLLRSGTSIGALIREAEYAESKPDFIHKLAIALKEANETHYWIELMYQTKYLENENFSNLESEIVSIKKILTSIINSSKSKIR